MQSDNLKKIAFSILAMVFSITVNAQEEKVVGKVIDARDGLALPGVSVKVKGQQKSSVTDVKGQYSIMVDTKQGTLVFSFLGYKSQEVKIAGRTTINISLAEDRAIMDEVVVVGYGTKKKNEILGAVATISGKELEDIPAPNIAAALRNRIAGVSVSADGGRPGAGISLNIRNSYVSTQSGNNGATDEPLYIIDGLQTGLEQFNALDPSMIENITILKDASAAIYGATGAKGVVLVTTKRGTTGKPRFSYSGYVGVSDAARTPDMLNAYEQAVLLNENLDFKGDQADDKYFSAADLEYLKNLDFKSWRDELWKPALTQRHNVTMSGGSENVTYFIGGNYQNQNANYADMKEDKYGFRSGMKSTIAEAFSVDIGFNVNYKEEVSKNGLSATDNTFYQNLVRTPMWVPIQIDGKPVHYGSIKNPLGIVNSGYLSKSGSTDYSINANLSYAPKFINGLKASLRIGQSGSNSSSETYEPGYKQYEFVRTGSLGQFLGDSVIAIRDGKAQKDARLAPGMSRGSRWQGSFQVDYTKSINKHNISAMVGGEKSKTYSEGLDIYWNGQTVAGVPEYWSFDQTQVTFKGRPKSDGLKQSFFSRVSYSYDGKYMVDLVGRMDASSNFALKNIWGKFGNVALGWNIAREKFFSNNIGFINNLKLRASYGVTGDDRVNRLWKEIYKVDLVNTGYLYNNSSQPTFNPGTIPNPNISWEKARSLNAGIDAGFFNDKINFQIDVFRRFNYDQFDKNNDQNFPMYAGFIAPVINHFERYTWGTEMTLSYSGKIGKELKFNTGVNFGIGNAMVTQTFYNKYHLFYNTASEDFVDMFGLLQNKWDGGNYGWISKGILKTQADVDALLKQYPNYTINGQIPQVGWLHFEDTNEDGKIDEFDRMPMFNRPSPYVFGINLGFKYKSLALSTNMVANIGGKVYYDSRAQDEVSLTNNVGRFFLNRWSPENPNGKFPRADDPGAKENSTFWAVDGTMLRINNMTLSYSVPKKVLDKIGFSSVRLMATGNNLWTIINPLPYKDPYSGNLYDYPTLRTISLGLNVGF